MVQIKLTEEQARLIQHTLAEPLQLCDPQGKVLRTIAPEYTKEFIAELKRRAATPGPRYTGAQVQARLRALQQEWDRTGGFDEAHMRDFLDRLEREDPGHLRPKRQAE
jgi:hypothetical protein